MRNFLSASSILAALICIVVLQLTIIPIAAQSSGTPSAQTSVQAPQTPQHWAWCGVTIVESSPIRLVLDYKPQVKGFDTITSNGKILLTPKILGTVLESERVGAALSAELRIPVTIPSPKGCRIGSFSATNVRGIKSAMAPKARINARGEREYQLLNDEIQNSGSVPAWYTLKYSGIARDRHTAMLYVRAARYNQETQSIEIPESVRITIDFTPENLAPVNTAPSLANAGFASSINHAQTGAWILANTPGNTANSTPNQTSAATTSDYKERTATLQSVAGRWLKIGVERDGIYRITAQQLRDAGITVSNAEIPTIQLFGNGGTELPESVLASANNRMREQPLLVETDANGALTAITFFGSAPNGFIAVTGANTAPRVEHFVNTFTRRNFYMLNVGGNGVGRRVTFAESPAQATITPQYHISRVFRNDDIQNPFDYSTLGSGRRWFGQSLPHNRATRFETPLWGFQRGTVPVRYRVSAAWNNSAGAGPGGKIFVRESGTELFSTPFSFFGSGDEYTVGAVETRITSLPNPVIQSTGSTLEFLYLSNSGDDAHGKLDFYEIHYPRGFAAQDNQLDFFTDTPENLSGVAEYTVRGFTGNQVFIVDASDRANPQFLRNISQTGGQASFRAAISAQNPRRFYLSSQALSPLSLERADDVADLRGAPANAELIIITHKDLLPSAQAYRDYRQRQSGMTTTLVTTDQIYYQFNGGTPDPTALRDYIAHAYRTWTRKPGYVLLWGDGHFDYRSIMASAAARNLVPTYQTYDADGDMNSVNTNLMTEDYFACVNGEDNLVDLAIGRLCVRDNTEGETMLSKIRRYETASSPDNWRTQILLSADDGPTKDLATTDRTLHTGQSEDLANFVLPSTVRVHKTYLPDFSLENSQSGRRRPGATQDLIATVNEGALILNWIGHGNPNVWADERFLQRETTVPQFTNLDRLFFLVAATCDFARFDNYRTQSGAEDMVGSARGGAIAVFAAARTVYAIDNAAISQELYRQIFRNTGNAESPRLGDLVYRVKQLFFSGSFDNDRKFYLLGDPTVRLALPDQPVAVDSINGISLANGTLTPQVKALSQMSISGFVGNAAGAVDTSFSGTILASLFDSDVQRAVADVDFDRTIHRITSTGGLLNIGASTVRNGRYRFSMPIPKDISFTNKNGRLFLYAVSNDAKKFGRGATTQFIVGDVDETAVNDGIGPEVRIFLDSRTFRAGDFVSSTPTLLADIYDATGVNATGTGIGHDIQAWIDNNPLPITLTQSYRVSLEDPRRGTVERVLPNMSPGLHRVRVRAWDIFNNFSEAETFFRVVGADSSLILTELANFPNPFSDETTIRFRHNQVSEQPYVVDVYSVFGAPVMSFSGVTSSRTVDIPWNGRDASGNAVSSGVYLFQVRLQGTNGQTQSASGKIVRSR